MWEFNPEGPRAIQRFLGMTHEEMYKLFFGPQIICPDITKDAGLRCNRPDTPVSSPHPKILPIYLSQHCPKKPLFDLGLDSEGKVDQVSGPPP